MHRLFAAFASVLAAAHAPTAFAADACSLLSQSDAAAILGQPIAQVTPAGPRRDEDSSGQLTYCTYRGASSALIVSVVEFTSGAEARKQLTSNLVRERMDAEDAKVSEEPGLGEKSYYGTSARGSMFVFLKKNRVVGVGVGGEKQNKSVTKDSLRSVAQTVSNKV
jgi:hypothetical protein